jgi:hypothetical protein
MIIMSKMIDLPNKIRNRNVRVVIHDDKLEDVIKDVTIYIKWIDGFWYPSKNLNIWVDAFEIVKIIIKGE